MLPNAAEVQRALLKVMQTGGAAAPAAAVKEKRWPSPLGRIALQGLVGEILDAIGPHTESDPAAIVFQTLTFFGSLMGRGPHWRVESTNHFTNLFICICGETSRARKGTSLNRVRDLFSGIDPDWDRRNYSGLSTGEGLIHLMRDAVMESVPVKGGEDYALKETDPGVSDKRTLIIESEFARTLSVGERQGNTLSPILRDAWDSLPLQVLTKKAGGRCAEPHVSIIAHITLDEVLKRLADVEIGNGFANRFCFVLAKRSKHLPLGGDSVDMSRLKADLADAVKYAPRGLVALDPEAQDHWCEVYEPLTKGRTGLLGAITARAEAHVLRFALLFALLDGSGEIRLPHLLGGLELWRYIDESSMYIFGDRLGDATADELLEALGRSPDGLTRTDLRNVFQGHKSSAEIGRALGVLQRDGKARCEKEQTGGRAIERWFVCF